jgi:hypothetical protein
LRLKCCIHFLYSMPHAPPISSSERSKACTVYDSLNIEIAGSNPAQGHGCVSACFCVVLSCVSVEALCWTDPPTKESYQMLCGSRSPLRKAEVR